VIGPSDDDLCYVIARIPSLAEQAWQVLLKRGQRE